MTVLNTSGGATGIGVGSENVSPNFMTDDEPRGPTTAPDVADAYEDWMMAMSSQEKLSA